MADDAVSPETTPPLPPPTRFEAVAYRPDGVAPPAGLALLLGGTLIAAVVLGYIASWISRWFWLVVVFPLAMGCILGGLGVVLVGKGRVRNPMLAGLAGALGGVFLMGSMHYFFFVNYVKLMRDLQQEAAAAGVNIDVDAISFVDFMKDRARLGVAIGRAGRGKPMNLGYTGSFIYWLAEAALAGGVAFFFMRAGAADPFCAACGTWKRVAPLANVHDADPETASAMLRDGNLAMLLQRSSPPADQGMVLKIAACPNCGAEAPVDVQLEYKVADPKGKTASRELAHVTYPGEVLQWRGAGQG